MGTYTKNLKLETPSYTDNADIPALTKKNNEIIDSEMIKRANGLDYNEQTGVLQLTGNNSKVGSPIQIKNNLPVTSMASGTELKVNNYKQLIKFTKEGKTEQKSYTGKNILDYITKLKPSGNGLTNVINDDGSITTAGKPTSNYTTITKGIDLIDLLEDGETYTISQEKYNTNIYIQITARKKDDTYTYYGTANTQKKVSLKIDKTINSNYYCSIQSNSTSNWGDKSLTITNKYMLCKGTDTADTSFEPYVGGQVSPNPDYPQKIKNVRGVENLLKLPDGTYESNGITAVIKDGVITLNGTATARSMITISLSTFKSGSYRIAANNEQTIGAADDSSDFAACRIAYTDGYVLRDCYLGKKNSSGNFTLSSDRNLNFIIRTAQGMTYNNFVIKPQLEEGPIAHNFVPNGSNYLQLKNVKKNLFDKNNLHFILGTVDVESITINNVGKSFYIKCKPNTTYTISRKIVGSRFVVGTTNGIPKQGEKVYDRVVNNAGSSITLTTSSNSNYLCVYYLLNSTENENNILDNIQIEEGSESTSYEQYQEKIINVDLKGNELCSDKEQTLKDELIIENGRAKIYKKIKEVVLDGSENWIKSGGSNSSRFVASLEITNIMKTKTFNALCNYFTYNIEFDIAKFHLFNTNTDGTARFIAFGVDASTISDLTQWKAFLKSLYDSGNPVRVQYELAEPEVIDLGEVDFDLIENSTLTCEEESDMQIDYLTIDSNIFVQDSLDGNSSQKAPSVDAIKKYFGKKVYDKDANGWIKIEFFDHTEYVTEGQITQIDFSTGWGVSKLLSLPVGMSTIGDRILSGNVRTFDAAISVNISAILTETQITYNWKNNHSSNVTTGLNYSLRILEYV